MPHPNFINASVKFCECLGPVLLMFKSSFKNISTQFYECQTNFVNALAELCECLSPVLLVLLPVLLNASAQF